MTDAPASPADAPFGTQLRRLRLAARLTQERLAERAGVSSRTVRDLERGTIRAPRFDTADLLADALGLAGDDRAAFFAAVPRDEPPRPADDARPTAPQTPVPALPRADAPLLGREDALADLLAELADPGARMVTLLGPGGVGKTRLAIEAARRVEAAGRPVAWTPLESLGTADEALPAIARAVGAAGQPQADPVRRIADAVAGRRLLLVVDNCEHVIAAARDLATLLDAAPDLQVLATSREALRIGPETRIPVDPLPVPHADEDDAVAAANPAVALFLDRAGRGRAAAALPDVRRVVTALDGLPLAIELAAAQAETMSVAAVARVLDRSGIEALESGRRDVAPRLRSMEEAVRWSYDLLDGRARRLLRVLSVFRGGADVDLLEETCARLGERDLVRGLPALARASMAGEREEEGRPRVRLLSPIRLFAAAELEAAGEAAAAELAHRGTMRDLARATYGRLMGPDALHALADLDRERDNLAAALDRAIQAGDARDAMAIAGGIAVLWEIRGEVAEGFRWLERALALDGPADPVELSRAGRVAALFAVFLGRADRWQAIAERMLAVAVAADDPAGVAIALTWLGDRAWYVDGDLAAARALHERAVATAEPAGDSVELAQACDRLGDVLAEIGDPAAAVRTFDRSVAIRRRLGNELFLSSALVMRSMALRALDRSTEARADLVEAAGLGGRLGYRVPVANAMHLIAAIDAASGDPARLADAARLLAAADAALARHRVTIDSTLAPIRARALADLATALGEPQRDRLLDEGRALDETEALALAGAGRKA